MNLSKNFTLEEFTFSQTAVRKGVSNQPSEAHLQSMISLCVSLLQPLRDRLNKPFKINSGYRSPALNKAVGGSQTSQHSKGEAVDFTVSGMTCLEVCNYIKDSGLVFDQLIYEGTWVHLSYNPNGKNRKQVLTAHFKDGGVSYTPGLPTK